MGNQISNRFLVVKPAVHHTDLLQEYVQVVQLLKSKGVEILELEMPANLESKQYLWSSHWLSFHERQGVAVYPMSTLDRQRERTDGVFDLLEENGFQIQNVIDFTEAETEGFFLEGTGSVVLDRRQHVAYASISKQCDEELFIEFCETMEYTPIVFRSEYTEGAEVAHTSCVLSISDDFAVLASGMIKDKKERKLVSSQLKKTGRKLMYITEAQVLNHVADIKQIKNAEGDSFVVLSKSVSEHITQEQRKVLRDYGALIVAEFSQTEKFGGRSIGTALNEVF